MAGPILLSVSAPVFLSVKLLQHESMTHSPTMCIEYKESEVIEGYWGLLQVIEDCKSDMYMLVCF